MGHIPVKDATMASCIIFILEWIKRFEVVGERFKDTIRGYLYGHTHFDEFHVLNDSYGNPMAPLFIAPSLTTYH
jgi:CRISPR/Cas system-associated endonuclease/helicase Cas3